MKSFRKKHEQLADALRSRIQSLHRGDRLPSQNELMSEYSVSDTTVLRALRELTRDGWIERQVGRGTFVARETTPVAVPAVPVASPRHAGTLVVVTLSDSVFYQQWVEELMGQAAQLGLRVVCHYAVGDTFPENDLLFLEALAPVGFLVFSHMLAGAATELRRRGHRVAVVGLPPRGPLPDLFCITGDHEFGAYLATRHLLGLGHRRLAYLTLYWSRSDLIASYRWAGHRRALKTFGIAESECPIFDADDLKTWRTDPLQCRRLFDPVQTADSITALVIWNDREAVEWLRVLQRAKIRVPEDVSLIAYDNFSVGQTTDPPLDTINPHVDLQIQRALDWVLNPADEPFPGTVPSLMLIVPTLLIRHSSQVRTDTCP